MDNQLNHVKQIISEEDLHDYKNTSSIVAYSYSTLKIKLYGIIPLWNNKKDEVLTIVHEGNRLVIRGFLAGHAVKKHTNTNNLLKKYGPKSEGNAITITSPSRNLLNILYFVSGFGLCLSLLSLSMLFDQRQGGLFFAYLLVVASSMSFLGITMIYRRNYLNKLDKILS